MALKVLGQRMTVAMRAFTIFCLAGLAACALPYPKGDNARLREEMPIAELPFLLEFTDDAARSMHLQLLRVEPLPDRAKEVRVWTGFGTTAPDFMLRFQIDPDGHLAGTMFAYFMKSKDDDSDNETVRSILRAMCPNVQSNDVAETCATVASETIRWTGIYRKLDRIGLWTLPDQSELPKPKFIMSDGASIVVELRDGKAYRAYEYSNPLMLEGIAAERAYEIMRVTGDVIAPVLAQAQPES